MKSLILMLISVLSLTACDSIRQNSDFIPYYTNGTEPHNTQWDTTELDPKYWTPQQWVASNKGDGLSLIQKWYNADIIRDQKVVDDAPTLVVGPNFYHLSGSDKRKIVQTIDHVYGVTSKSPKMFYLEDWATKQHIGFYSPKGLVLQ
jgi:hypothetical protein